MWKDLEAPDAESAVEGGRHDIEGVVRYRHVHDSSPVPDEAQDASARLNRYHFERGVLRGGYKQLSVG